MQVILLHGDVLVASEGGAKLRYDLGEDFVAQIEDVSGCRVAFPNWKREPWWHDGPVVLGGYSRGAMKVVEAASSVDWKYGWDIRGFISYEGPIRGLREVVWRDAARLNIWNLRNRSITHEPQRRRRHIQRSIEFWGIEALRVGYGRHMRRGDDGRLAHNWNVRKEVLEWLEKVC